MYYLYWWKDIPNVGDVASKYVIEQLSDAKICWKKPQVTLWNELKKMAKGILVKKEFRIPNFVGYVYPWQKCLFGIGSILDFSNYKTIVWGSGFREYESVFHGGKIAAVRGYLSKDKLTKKKYSNR